MLARRRFGQGLVAALLRGRLGNQLFQFAAAMALQPDDRPTPVTDSLWVPRPGGHAALVACLTPGATRELGQHELLMLGQVPRLRRGRWRAEGYRQTLASRFAQLNRFVFEESSPQCFDDRVPTLRSPVLLSGYFQNERYFVHVATTLRAKFRPASARVRAWFDHFTETSAGRPTVAIGFRHDDEFAALGWVLGDEYYDRALLSLPGTPDEYSFAVFGDSDERDLTRARRLLGTGAHVESAHRLSTVDQLNALSMFETLLIPNSTFSWWGAWLADHDHGFGARILAPDPWIGGQSHILPQRWQRIRSTAR